MNHKLIVNCALTTLLVTWAYPSAAARKAGFLLDDSTYTCADIYYGIGEPVDYPKAYACFEAHSIYEYMIVMQLNGEGVPQDVQKAEALMQAWLQADPDNANSIDETGMEGILKERLNDKNPNPPKINYCQDVGYTTISINFCAAVNDRMEQHQFGETMNSIRASLDPKQAATWDQIQATFAEYQKAEGERMYQQYADGTIRGAAYEGQVSYVRANFLKLMRDVFVAKGLAPVSAQESKKLEADLKSAYQADVDKYVDARSYLNDTNSSADDKKKYVDDIAEYKGDAENSQNAWNKLMGLCVTLASGVYQQKGVDWDASMAAAMAKIRILDIQNDSERSE